MSTSNRCCKVEDKANISCNLAGTPWEVNPSLYERQRRMLRVTLHLWTGLLSCQLGLPLYDKDDTGQIYVSDPNTAQLSRPLYEILENSVIELYDVLDANPASDYYMFALDDPTEYLKRFLIVVRNASNTRNTRQDRASRVECCTRTRRPRF